MRIGIVYTTLTVGGGTHQLVALAQELSKTNEVFLFVDADTTHGAYAELLTGVTIICVTSWHPTKHVMKLMAPFVWIRECWSRSAVIAKYPLDVLNPHESPSQVTAALVRLRTHVPVVWMCNDIWHIPGFEAQKEQRKLFWLVNHTFGWWFDWLCVRQINTIVVLDHRIKRIIEHSYRKPATVVRSGIDLELYVRRKRLEKGQFTFLCLSIFFPHRRFEDAILAFSKLHEEFPQVRLHIVGSNKHDHSYYESIKSLVKNQHLEKVVVINTKTLSEKEVRDTISSSEVFIFPNEKQTWGLAVIQAMALGVPCIVSEGAGVHEIIKDKVTGIVYPARDVEKLYKEMKRLYTNKKMREAIGIKASKYVHDTLSWNKYAGEMQAIFEELID